jgi:hypothetical protein
MIDPMDVTPIEDENGDELPAIVMVMPGKVFAAFTAGWAMNGQCPQSAAMTPSQARALGDELLWAAGAAEAEAED